MADTDYTTIKIPTDLAARIEEIVDEHRWGYRNRTEFIIHAIREGLKAHYDMAQAWADLHQKTYSRPDLPGEGEEE